MLQSNPILLDSRLAVRTRFSTGDYGEANDLVGPAVAEYFAQMAVYNDGVDL
jgi:hypothetical protein